MIRLFNFIKNIFFSVIIITALLKLIAYAITPIIPQYLNELNLQASKQFGLPVNINGIDFRWHRNGPTLWLYDTKVGEDNKLNLGDIYIDLDLLSFTSTEKRKLLRIHLFNTQLHLLRNTEGRFKVVGIGSQDDEDEYTSFNDSINFSGQLIIKNSDIFLEDQLNRLPNRLIANANLSLQFSQERVNINALINHKNEHFKVIANIERKNNAVKAYLHADNISMKPWLRLLLKEPLTLQKGKLNLEAWVNFKDHENFNIKGNLLIHKIAFENAFKNTLLINEVNTQFFVQRKKDTIKTELKHLSIKQKNDQITPKTIIVSSNLKTKTSRAYISQLSLSKIKPFLNYFDDANEIIFPTHGELKDVRLKITNINQSKPQWVINTHFNELSIADKEFQFSLDRISGIFLAKNNLIQVDLDSDNSKISLPGLFRQPIELTKLTGTLHWSTHKQNGWQIYSNKLLGKNQHIETATRLHLYSFDNRPLFADMQTNFKNGNAAYTYRYLPTGIMAPSLSKWLDDTITNGKVTKGSMLLYGPISDFPYDKTNNGHFETTFNSHHDSIIFDPEWPGLKNIDATTEFNNNSLDIVFHSTNLYSTKTKKASLQIKSLEPVSDIIIKTEAVGPANDLIKFLLESPLKKHTQNFVEALEPKGNIETLFTLKIPLDDDDAEADFKGSLKFIDTHLKVKDTDFVFKKLDGTIHINNEKLTANQISGEFFGHPIKIDIQSTGSDVNIMGEGQLDMDTIKQQFPTLKSLPLSGKSTTQIRLKIQTNSDKNELRLNVKSNLKGITSNLPYPLNKAELEKSNFNLNYDFKTQPKLSINYDDKFKLDLTRFNDRTKSSLGSYQFDSYASELDTLKWLEVINAITLPNSNMPTPKIKANITLDTLDIGSLTIDNPKITFDFLQNKWQGKIQSTSVSGEFSLPSNFDKGIAKLHLNKLNLNFYPDLHTPSVPGFTSNADKKSSIDPRNLPAIDFTCDNLFINDKLKGSFKLQASKVGKGLLFEEIIFNSKDLELETSGTWLQKNNYSKSTFNGYMKIPSLETLSRKLDIPPQFQDAPTKLFFNINWLDSPLKFELEKLSGTASVSIDTGQLSEIKPGVMRLFGLLNLEALKRRLKLDFDDVSKKGLGFDTINGNFDIDRGDAYTNNLTILGPFGEINVSGRTGLATYDYDQIISVKPAVDSSLVIAGALVAGPVGGVIGFLAQQVISGKIDKVNHFLYTLKGNWREPVIEPIVDE